MAENYIKKKIELNKKKQKRKKYINILMLFIVLISVLITICLKLDYFNIQKIDVVNNKNLTNKEIIELSNISTGHNIFTINLKTSRNNLLKNPNIMDANIKRVLPSKIIITINEREAAFYITKDNKNIIVSKDGVVLGEEDNLVNEKLMKLDGVEVKNCQVGKVISVKDPRILNLMVDVADLYDRNTSQYTFTSVDLSNLLSINIYFNNICAKLGTADNLQVKLNKVINIIDSQGLADKKGYVDVSYDGNPVFCIEK